MFAIWLAVFMDGTQCDAIAVCDEAKASCTAHVLACDAPVRLSACLNEGAAFAQRELVDGEGELLWPVYVLGCSTDLSAGWPASVELDQEEISKL